MARTDGKKGPGRPSKYEARFSDMAFNIALLGCTDADLARIFDVDVDTIKEWKKVHPEFSAALKAGKDEADSLVVKSLYQRARGYSHDAVKIVADAKTGSEHVVPFVEHYPPDTTACIFWLKNRQREKWRDKVEQDVNHTFTPSEILDELKQKAKAAQCKAQKSKDS